MPMSSSSELVTDDHPETPNVDGAYPRLTEEQIAFLSRFGTRRAFPARSTLYCEGDRECDFFVVLAGRVAVVQETDEGLRLIAVHGPGRFVGDLSLLTGQTMYLTAIAPEEVEALGVPLEGLKQAVTEDAKLGDLILRAFIARRTLHLGIGAGLRIIGSRFSAETRRIREFVSRNRIPHKWIDIEQDREAETILKRLGIPPEQTPVVIYKGSRVLRNPSNVDLAGLLGLRESASRSAYDVVVVGAGPAGLAAAVYAASEGLSAVVLDAVATGGQAATSSRIENYLGFPAGISGGELADRAMVQARRFGAEFTIPGQASSLALVDGCHVLRLLDGEELSGHAMVLATGAQYRRLDAPGLEHLEAPSVYYAATEAEAQLCQGDPVMVVGGGNSAGQAALFLSKNASCVHLVIRHNDLERDMSRYLSDRIVETPHIRVWRRSEVAELRGDEALTSVVVRSLVSDERHELDTTALFVLIGAVPHTAWLKGQLPLDERGFVLTGAPSGPGMFETGRPGIFAAGDVRSGSVKRVASAVGEGAIAVRMVHEYLGHRRRP
jgi:thioredoxin reductase (NADPH)